MLFENSELSVRVIMLDHSLWTERRAVIDSIMKASACVGKANRTYLALPKIAASVTDAGSFQKHGIGLLTYDHRNIEEALQAQHFEAAPAAEHAVANAATLQLQNELRELRAEFTMLEQIVQHLRQELASSKTTPPLGEPDEMLALRGRPTDVQVMGDLPAFFAGNPWVGVLSRRGRENPIVS